MIFILNRHEKTEVILTNNGSPESCPYYDDVLKEDIATGASSYEFKVPSTHPASDKINEGDYVVRRNLDNKLVMFQIIQLEEQHGTQGNYKYVYSETAGLELLTDLVRPATYMSQNAKQILDIVLQDTRWQKGTVEYFGVDNFYFDGYDNVFSTLQYVSDKLGGELRFRVNMKNGVVTGRYVDLIAKRGTDTKKRFTYSKDINSIKRTVDMTSLVTALIGVGKGDTGGNALTFKNISRSISGGDAFSKPLNQDWVGDPTALQRYGVQGKHIFGYFEYDTTEVNTLLDKTWAELQRRKNPKISYDLDVALLERLAGLEHEKVRIGDTIYVIDETFNPSLYLEARILNLETCFSDPTKDKCTIGNFKTAKSNITAQMRALQSKLLYKEASWDTFLYTWIKYADDASGSNMSDSPTGKAYIGIAANKATAEASTTPSDYQWSLMQGAVGAQGNPAISYTWNFTNVVKDSQGNLYKNGGVTNTWDSQAYTSEAFVGGAFLSFRPVKNNEQFMMALNFDPATDANYTGLDYAYYIKSDGTVGIFESGTSRGTFGTYAAGDSFQIVYDGANVKYYHNGTLDRTVTGLVSNLKMFVDSSFYTKGTSNQVKDIYFGPAGPIGATGPQGPQGNVGATGPQGPAGTNAMYVVLSGPLLFKYASGAAIPTNTTVALVATPYNISSPTYQWQYWNGTAWTNLTKAGYNTANYTVAYNDTEWGSNTTLRYRCLVNGSYSDEVTLTKLYDGAQGPTGNTGSTGPQGNPGTNALTVILTNTAHTVPTDSAGNNGVYTGSETDLYLYEGTTPLTFDGVGTANGTWKATSVGTNISAGAISIGSSPNRGIAAVASGMTADTASIVFTITGKRADGTAISLTQTQTFSKSKTGSQGATGSQGPTGSSGVNALSVVLSNPTDSVPTDSAGNNGNYTGTGTTIYLYEGTTALTYDGVGTSNGTWKVTAAGSSITPGSITDSGVYATIGNASAMTADTALITFTITGKRADGTAISLTQTQTFSKAKAGTNGVTTYTWTKFAIDELGGNMSDSPSGMRYIGLAFNKTTATESTLASDYTWSPLYDNVQVGARNIFNNSALRDNATAWTYTLEPTWTTTDGFDCGMWSGALATTRYIKQSMMGNLEAGQTYTMSGWIKVENIVKGTTNYTMMFYTDGYYNNAGVSTWYGFQSKQFDVTKTGWQFVSFQITVDPTKYTNATSCDFYIYVRDFTGNIYFRDLKVEKGNVATDWTPAPGDIQALIDSKATDSDLDALATIISQVSTDLDGKTNAGDFQAMKDDYDAFIAQNITDSQAVSAALATMDGRVTLAETLVGDAKLVTDFINTVITESEEGIYIANNASSTGILIASDRISFMDNNVEVAYISNQTMQINHGIFVESAVIANFKFELIPNTTILSITWVGD